MQKTTLTTMTLFTLLTLPQAVLAGSITYNLVNYPTDQNGCTLSGAITTDGQTGVLSPSDILSWSWTITGARVNENGIEYPLPPISAAGTSVPNADLYPWTLVATPSQILLPRGGVLDVSSFMTPNGNVFLYYWNYPETYVSPAYFAYVFNPANTSEIYLWLTSNPAMGGNDPWVVASSVPEPSTLYLLVFGTVCGSVYVMGHKRSRRRTATTDG